MVISLPALLRVAFTGIGTAALIIGLASDGYGQSNNHTGPAVIRSSSLPSLVGMTGTGQVALGPPPRLSALEFGGVVVIPNPACEAFLSGGFMCFEVFCRPPLHWIEVCLGGWGGYGVLPTMSLFSAF